MSKWAKYFLEDRRVLTSPPSLCVRRAAELFTSRRKRLVLDLGCGAGRDTACLAQAGLEVAAADIEPAGLSIARRCCEEKRLPVHLFQADARMLPFANAEFEGVYSFGLLHDFTSMDRDRDIRRVMGEVHRILRPDGLLVLAVLSGDFRFSLPDVYLFSGAMFREAARDFEPIEMKEHEDIGCTGKTDYKVWYGAFVKKGGHA
jgi:SAM-dependent methyltransferase